MTVAKRRAIDLFRRNERLRLRYSALGRELIEEDASADAALDRVVSEDIDDDLLRLVFTACHPVLSVPARVALTLRLLGGLTTAEIARAYLVPEPTVAQRIVRAKKALADAEVPFEVPDADERPARLASVLEVIYLIFNEGYAASAGEDWMRPALCADALRLGRVLAQIDPDEPEVHGLVALMEIQASRLTARVDDDGAPVLLLDQDRTRWDGLLIRRGLAALARAEELGGATGPYALQAGIAACHARAARAEDTDWARVAALYGLLALVQPSPVVQLNRAVALASVVGQLRRADGAAEVDLRPDQQLLGPEVLGAQVDEGDGLRGVVDRARDLVPHGPGGRLADQQALHLVGQDEGDDAEEQADAEGADAVVDGVVGGDRGGDGDQGDEEAGQRAEVLQQDDRELGLLGPPDELPPAEVALQRP